MNMGLVKLLPGWSVMLITATVALIASCLLYRYIERPLLTKLYRFGRVYIHAGPVRARATANA
jgi:peptidoglycan/LPS O-acetylase OafA/YrhL